MCCNILYGYVIHGDLYEAIQFYPDTTANIICMFDNHQKDALRQGNCLMGVKISAPGSTVYTGRQGDT